MDDTRLIAETCELEQVWRVCTAAGCVRGRVYDEQCFRDNDKGLVADCTDCHGTGKVPFIDASNILDVIVWARQQPWWNKLIRGYTKKITYGVLVGRYLQGFCENDYNSPEELVGCIKAVIAGAIRAEGARPVISVVQVKCKTCGAGFHLEVPATNPMCPACGGKDITRADGKARPEGERREH